MMPSSYPSLFPTGCCHLLSPHSLWLTEDFGISFRLPFHSHSCHHLKWAHHLHWGIIQQPNCIFLDLLPKCAYFLLQATCSQGHMMKPCCSELIIVQSLAPSSCSSSFLMPHSHNTGSLTSQKPTPSVPLSSYAPLHSQTSPSLPSLDPMLDHLNLIPSH